MSISLPKELQTQKISSLSGELKSIAEELIADKFDIQEDVAEMSPPLCIFCHGGGCGECIEYNSTNIPYFDKRSEAVTYSITLNACYGLVRSMKERGIPERGLYWQMGAEEFDHLSRELSAEYAIRYSNGRELTIFGIEVERICSRAGFIRLAEKFRPIHF